ncbi:hypothetical protein TcCL_NonESM13064 [Trypanosoma cruzi]|nr:hypothetical protein TcCL_NonESM13064 [Trypanosoma cruzi]
MSYFLSHLCMRPHRLLSHIQEGSDGEWHLVSQRRSIPQSTEAQSPKINGHQSVMPLAQDLLWPTPHTFSGVHVIPCLADATLSVPYRYTVHSLPKYRCGPHLKKTAQCACKVLVESYHCVGWQRQRTHTLHLFRKSKKIAISIQLRWASQTPLLLLSDGVLQCI